MPRHFTVSPNSVRGPLHHWGIGADVYRSAVVKARQSLASYWQMYPAQRQTAREHNYSNSFLCKIRAASQRQPNKERVIDGGSTVLLKWGTNACRYTPVSPVHRIESNTTRRNQGELWWFLTCWLIVKGNGNKANCTGTDSTVSPSPMSPSIFKILLRQFWNLYINHGAFSKLVDSYPRINHRKKIQIHLEYNL